MIHDMHLPICLWVETCDVVVYILDTCSHNILKDKTLEEAFNGEKPHVYHFCVFGCLVNIHVLGDKPIYILGDSSN
jgi:hypothetical protein